jgi:hypothetical protein
MLHVPVGSNSFGNSQASWGTTRPAAANGTVVTPGLNADGSWTQVVASAGNDSYGVLINVNSNTASAASRNSVVDVGVDEAGGTSYVERIPDLLCGGAAAYNSGGSGVWYYFPMLIPAGARIAARGNSSVATAFRVGVVLMQKPSNPAMVRGGSFVDAIGMTAGNIGTAFTPGTTAEGAWTLLGTTSNRLWWWQVGVQVPTTDTAWGAGIMHVDLAVGDATNKDIIIQDTPITFSTAEAVTNIPVTVGVEWDVPSGSNIYVRGQFSGTLDTYHATAYGLGG